MLKKNILCFSFVGFVLSFSLSAFDPGVEVIGRGYQRVKVRFSNESQDLLFAVPHARYPRHEKGAVSLFIFPVKRSGGHAWVVSQGQEKISLDDFLEKPSNNKLREIFCKYFSKEQKRSDMPDIPGINTKELKRLLRSSSRRFHPAIMATENYGDCCVWDGPERPSDFWASSPDDPQHLSQLPQVQSSETCKEKTATKLLTEMVSRGNGTMVFRNY